MVEPRVTWRFKPVVRIVYGTLAAFMCVPTAGGVINVLDGRFSVWFVLGTIEFPLFAIWLWRAGVRASITLTDQELLIKNPVRTYRFRLSDIASADPGYSGIVIATSSGENVCAWAVQKSNIAELCGWHTRADHVAAAITEAARVAQALGHVDDLDEIVFKAALRRGSLDGEGNVPTLDIPAATLALSRVPLLWQLPVLAGLVAVCVITGFVGGADHERDTGVGGHARLVLHGLRLCGPRPGP